MAEKKVKAKAAKKTAGSTAAKGTKAKPAAKAAGAKAAPKKAKKTTFKLKAPEAQQVFVAGCFNEWDTAADALERGDDGVWMCTLTLEPGEHEYRFVVDGTWWDDPLNMERRQNEFGCENCIIVV